MKNNHYENRLICYLDVLGYSSMVRERGIDEVYSKYASFVDVAKTKVFFGTPDDYEGPSDNFEISEIVSDSILLVSHDVSNIASVNNFIGSIHFLLELGLASGFMFRGCVSQGDIIFDKERSIFLSEEFNEMAKFEPKMDVPVCVIFERASATVIGSIFGEEQRGLGIVPARSLPIIKWSIPLKKDVRKDYWCINYTYFCDRGLLDGATGCLAGDSAKQENFVDYLNFLEVLPEDVLHPATESEATTFVKIMKSRSGMRVAFVSNEGDVVHTTSHMGFPAVFVEPPKEITITVDPETKQLSFNAQGRWY